MNAIEQVFGTGDTTSVAQPKKELGQEDFLKLLVAQLENQDPNNPADNGEFLSQIAQFSMVSGIDDLGTSFDGVANSLYTSQAMQASQLVGKQVLTETDTALLTTGETVDGVLDLPINTSNIRVKIESESGTLIRAFDLEDGAAGLQNFTWNGLDEEGNAAVTGKYEITAEGLIDGELQGLSVQIYSGVESVSVDRNNATVRLNLGNDKSVNFSQVREYR